MIDEKKFIERLRILMQESSAGSNATEYGELVGCTGKTISNALKGKVPGIDILSRITDKKASVSWLIGETDHREYDDDEHHIRAASMSDPGATESYQESKQRRELISRFRTLFDFLEETYPENSIADSIKQHLRIERPDYRLWEYEKKAEIEEAIKKGIGIDMVPRSHQKVSNAD